MNVLPVRELVAALVCPMCRGGSLQARGPRVVCAHCAQSYGLDEGVLSFLVAEQLSETNRNEIKGNTFAEDYVERILAKEDWSSLMTHQMKWVVDLVSQMIPADTDELFALGTGTGFDLRLLLRHRPFPRVYASDISPAATALVQRSVAEYSGELGLFASEFLRCPVAKGPRKAGLVFQALHHAPDAHVALATLLDHNFEDLVIVEPLTNRLFGVLARFDLVQRVEYTGTRPDWLDLQKIADIARTRGYAMSSNTWWEIPPYFSSDWLNSRPKLWHGFYQLVDGFSRATNVARFGSMAAIHLTRN